MITVEHPSRSVSGEYEYLITSPSDAASLVYRTTKGMDAHSGTALERAIVAAVEGGETTGTWRSPVTFSCGTNAGDSVGTFRWRLRDSLQGEHRTGELERLSMLGGAGAFDGEREALAEFARFARGERA